MVDKQNLHNLADEHKLEYVKPLFNQINISIHTEFNVGLGDDGNGMSNNLTGS